MASTKTISLKQAGQNLLLVIDGEKYSKRFENADERSAVVAKIKGYNEKNDTKVVKEIKELFTTKKEKAKVATAKVKEVKEKIVKEKEAVKKEPEIKLEDKINDLEKQLKEAKDLLAAQNQSKPKPEYNAPTSQRRGEY